jgi:hypothetical protein
MSEITITELEPDTFGVEIDEGHQTTGHRIRLDREILAAAGLGAVAPETIVRETFHFLLEREPATAILPEFGLDTVQRYFPEYLDDLSRRLS